MDHRLSELRAELRQLLHSMEYAYAMGARRTLGARDPRFDPVVERVDALEREIAELDGRRRRAEADRDGRPPAA